MCQDSNGQKHKITKTKQLNSHTHTHMYVKHVLQVFINDGAIQGTFFFMK